MLLYLKMNASYQGSSKYMKIQYDMNKLKNRFIK